MPEKEYSNRIYKWMYIINPKIQTIVFIPFIIIATTIAIKSNLSPIDFLIGFGISIAFWTIFEYLMHRNFFHASTSNNLMQKLLYSIHLAHHDYPNDDRIMLVNPLISIPTALMVYLISFLIIGIYAHPFIIGVMIIYLVYDWFHFASHNKNYNNWWFQLMKHHHMKHHFQNSDKNYGFTSTIWDKILNTEIKEENKS